MVNPDTAAAATATASSTKTLASVSASAPLERAPSSPPLFASGLAIAAIAAVAFFLKRRGPVAARRMRVVETLALGPKRSLCLAEIDGRTLVLGVSEAGVSLVSSHEPPLFAAEPAQPLPAAPSLPLGTAFAAPSTMLPPSKTPPAPMVPAPRPTAPSPTPSRPLTRDLNDAFDVLLREATAEQELRSRLQQQEAMP